MRIPLFLAHGDPVILFGLLFVALFFSYGIPAIVWLLIKRKNRTAAVVLGVCASTVSAALVVVTSVTAVEGAVFSILIFAVIPLVLSVVATKAAYRLPTTSADKENTKR